MLEPRRLYCPDSNANLTTTTLPNQPEFDKDKRGKTNANGGLVKPGGKVYLVLPSGGTEEKGRLLLVNFEQDLLAQKRLLSAKSLHLSVCNLADNISSLSSTPKLGRFGYMKKVDAGGIRFLPSSTHF